MNTVSDLALPLSDSEYDELDEFLLDLEYEDAIYCVSELDGFITAIVSGPESIPPSRWLELVWGNQEQSPAWDSEEDFMRMFSLLIRHLNSTAATLMESPEDFEACFLEHTVGENTYTVVDEWCTGYMKGVALCPERWDEMPCAQEDYLAPMLMFSTESGWAQLEEMETEEIEFWQRQVEVAARRIHAFWLEQRSPDSRPQYLPSILPMAAANDEPYARGAPKVGRNGPCHCGSGKKYKACCGLH